MPSRLSNLDAAAFKQRPGLVGPVSANVALGRNVYKGLHVAEELRTAHADFLAELGHTKTVVGEVGCYDGPDVLQKGYPKQTIFDVYNNFQVLLHPVKTRKQGPIQRGL